MRGPGESWVGPRVDMTLLELELELEPASERMARGQVEDAPVVRSLAVRCQLVTGWMFSGELLRMLPTAFPTTSAWSSWLGRSMS